MAKILIVEDDKILNQAYEMILKKQGHDVEIAENGAAALEKAESFKPAIIFLDLLMPVMDGLQFLKEYDALEKNKKVHIIVLSNLGDDARVKKAMKLGAYKYIVKAHASPTQLAIMVNHVITKSVR